MSLDQVNKDKPNIRKYYLKKLILSEILINSTKYTTQGHAMQ